MKADRRLKAYGDLRDLIFRGFLTYNFDFRDISFVFRTINNMELDQIQSILNGKSDDLDNYAFHRNVYFLAYSTYMLNGINVLKDRSYYLNRLVEFFKGLPSMVTASMGDRLAEAQEDVKETSKYIEGFCYSEESRKRWKVVKGFPPNSEEFTGIPGTSELGINSFQEAWISFNQTLDAEERYEEEFSLAVLVASASNPKGSKKIQNSFNARKSQLEEKRKNIYQFGYREAEQKSRAGWAAPVDTREELVSELLRQIRGEKDKHDHVVDKYFDSLVEQAEEKEAEQQRMAEEARKIRGDDPIVGSTRVLTPKEAEELMNRKPRTTISVPSEDQVSREDRKRLISKVGSRVLSSKGKS